MQAAFLNLDNALAGQPALRECARQKNARLVEAADLGPAFRLWARPGSLQGLSERLRDHLPTGEGARLVFAGSGDFHHVTPALLARALEVEPGPVCVVHVDNHPDWVRYGGGVHCGSWVGVAARTAGVAKVITIGVCSPDVGRGRRRAGDLFLVSCHRHVIYAYRSPDGGGLLTIGDESRPTIEAAGLAQFIDQLLADITTSAVYITIDKDALRPADAATNWDQGRMSADELLAILARIAERHRIIGADVVGDWSRPVYGGGLLASAMKRGEAMLDQPWRAPVDANRVNEAVNLRLLEFFAEAA